MSLILKYSPFHTESQLMKVDKLDGGSGTLVIVYNLKLLDNGDPELDVKSDQFDILLSNPDTEDFDSDQGYTFELLIAVVRQYTEMSSSAVHELNIQWNNEI